MSISYSTIILFCIGLVIAHCCVGLLYREIEYLRLFTISVSVYFTVFVIVSGFFFWLDQFAMTIVLSVILGVFALGSVIAAIIRKSFRLSLTYKKDRFRWLYWVILVGFLISAQKFSFFGMGQDQGAYQTKAIALAAGETEQQLFFEEYDNLSELERSEATEKTRKLAGFDFYDSRKPTLNQEGVLGTAAGIFHGIPTFPALLALFELMLGLSNMQAVQSIFFLCTSFFVLLIVEDLALKKGAQFLAISIVALCPIIQWVMKSALTEGFLCLLFAGIVFGILSKNKNEKWLSVLFVWGFSFYHVTIYTMIPLFLTLFFIIFLETENRLYLLMGIITMLGFSIGYTMMLFVSPTYSYNNTVLAITFLQKWGEDKILPIVWCLTVLVTVLYFITSKLSLQVIYRKAINAKGFEWLIRAVMLLSFALIVKRGIDIYMGKVDRLPSGLSGLRMMTVFVFAYGSGVFSFAFLCGKVFFKPREVLLKRENLLTAITFCYCVLLMSALIRREILYCYYYSRYLAPFFVIIAITTGVILNTISDRMLFGLSVCGMSILLPFDWTLATKLDDSRMEWDVVEEVLSFGDENDAFVVDDGLRPFFVIPIKTATDCDVYPVLSDFDKQMVDLSELYEDVFIVVNPYLNNVAVNETSYSTIYCNNYYTSEDDGHYIGKLFPFPYDFYESYGTVAVMKFEKPYYLYDFSNNTYPLYGFDRIENDYYRWISAPEAGFVARIAKENYSMHIITGPGIPLSQLGVSQYQVQVYANSYYCGTINLENSTDKEYSILVPAEYLSDGLNEFCFKSDTWSPSQLGNGDNRQLGISISSISFEISDEENIFLDFGENENFGFTGFSGHEERFRWTNSAEATITTTELWSNKDYTCDVVLGSAIPNACFQDGVYEITIYINDESYKNKKILLSPGQNEFSFDIDASDTFQGENTFTIVSDLWSPSDFGSTDTRVLGICIDKLVFTPKQ